MAPRAGGAGLTGWLPCLLWAWTASAAPDAELLRRFDRLVDWMQTGINEAGLADKQTPLKETFALRQGPYGNGLGSLKDFEEGATLALLPLNRLITDRVYKDAVDHFLPAVQAAVLLAQLRREGAESFWSPWVDMLPKDYNELPKHWPPSLMEEHLQGSHFPAYVDESNAETAGYWEQVSASTGLSWEEFEWARDAVYTRNCYFDGTKVGDDKNAPSGMMKIGVYPFFDLMAHQDENNVEYDLDGEFMAVRMYAVRPIKSGDLLSIEYFTASNRNSNWMLLNKWGFAQEDATHMVEIQVEPEDVEGNVAPLEKMLSYALEETAQDGAAQALLGLLRARNHDGMPIDRTGYVPEGWKGIPDAQSGWLFYWNVETGETTWHPNGEADERAGPVSTPATTWRVERPMLQMAQRIFEKALAGYPQTLQEDEELLTANNFSDLRVRAAVLVRRGEKRVLHYWLAIIRHALATAPSSDDAPVNTGYVDFDPHAEPRKTGADEL